MLDTHTSAPRIKGMFIGGDWTPGARDFDDINPSTGAVWARVPDGGRTETRAAIAAAQAAFPAWAALHFQDRAKVLLKAADIWDRRKMDFVAAAQAEGGGWFGKGMFEAGYVPEVFRAAAAMCYNAVGEMLPSQHGKVSMVERVPMGVISVISPWNMPGILTARGFAFPLAAGNTIVLKPSEDTPYAGGLYFAEIMEEAGLPKGVFNVVTCSRDRVAEMGDELVENPLVKGISFTGSTPVGRQIAAKAGAHLKKACVELGGKDSLIVLEDADMDRATSAASFGAFMHQGQICMSVKKALGLIPKLNAGANIVNLASLAGFGWQGSVPAIRANDTVHVEDARIMDRPGTPQDLAPIVAFLLSDMTTWIRGTNIPADGGMSSNILSEMHGLSHYRKATP